MIRLLPKYRGDNPFDALTNLYRDLGWDGEKEVEPTKVVLSEKDSDNFMGFIMDFAETKDERIGLGLLYVNKGPSGRAEVPVGKVRLERGWLI